MEGKPMNNNKFLSALCYFSVLFSPLLLPAIIYFVTDDKNVKFHSKRSLISHLVPVALLIAGFIIFSLSMFSFENRMLGMVNSGFKFWDFAPLVFMLLYSLLFIMILVWNLFQGVKVLK
jgi:hypothetical protein